ncbi:hypothetical protein GCM10022205_18600 [Spinactinospora alkalitolerans]
MEPFPSPSDPASGGSSAGLHAANSTRKLAEIRYGLRSTITQSPFRWNRAGAEDPDGPPLARNRRPGRRFTGEGAGRLAHDALPLSRVAARIGHKWVMGWF